MALARYGGVLFGKAFLPDVHVAGPAVQVLTGSAMSEQVLKNNMI
jgi:hypothetical protein